VQKILFALIIFFLRCFGNYIDDAPIIATRLLVSSGELSRETSFRSFGGFSYFSMIFSHHTYFHTSVESSHNSSCYILTNVMQTRIRSWGHVVGTYSHLCDESLIWRFSKYHAACLQDISTESSSLTPVLMASCAKSSLSFYSLSFTAKCTNRLAWPIYMLGNDNSSACSSYPSTSDKYFSSFQKSVRCFDNSSDF